MTRLFLRIYLAVAVAIGLVIITMIFLVTSTALPERNASIERLVAPALHDLSTRLSDTEPEARRALLREQQIWTGPTLAILPLDVIEMDEAERGRLDRGEVVVLGSELARFAYARIKGEPNALELELYGISSAPNQWATWPVEHIAATLRTSKEGQPDTSRIPEARILQTNQLELSPAMLARLDYHTVNRPSPSMHASRVSYVPLGDGAVLQVEARPEGPESLRWFSVILCLLLTAVAVLLTIAPLHKKLKRLSEVAEAFEVGNLKARAALPGHGPIEDLARRFDGAAERIQSLLDAQEDLLRAVSHELRTPIARLFFSADLIAQEADPAARADLASGMEETLEQMRALTTELLNFTRLSEGTPELALERCSVASLVQGACQGASEHGQSLEIVVEDGDTDDLEVEAEPRLLRRALSNLITNAQKYAESQTLVTLGGDGDQVWVHVDDDGPGISPEDRPRILEPFVRLESSRSRETGGAGLGLAIVKRVIDRHGGTLNIGASPLGGARFTVRLPRQAAR